MPALLKACERVTGLAMKTPERCLEAALKYPTQPVAALRDILLNRKKHCKGGGACAASEEWTPGQLPTPEQLQMHRVLGTYLYGSLSRGAGDRGGGSMTAHKGGEVDGTEGAGNGR